jgi:hypothetical protein
MCLRSHSRGTATQNLGGTCSQTWELWHVVRCVFEGAKIAWTSPEAAADGIIDVKAVGSVEISRGGKKCFQAEHGCEFHYAGQTRDDDKLSL